MDNVIDLNDKQKELEQSWDKQEDGLMRTPSGAVKRLRANITKLLTEIDANLIGLFKYNEDTHEIEVAETRTLGNSNTTVEGGDFSDIVTKQVSSYISNTYLVDFSDSVVSDEIEVVAMRNSYSPIRLLLKKSLERSEETDPFPLIQKYLNVEDTEYNRLVFDLFFRGAIGRVLDRGCQFDYCLDLTGKQGAGKSTFLREVFKGHYTEIDKFNDKDEARKMVNAWVVLDDELVASNKATFEEIKRAITTRQIVFRPPYGRNIKRTPIDFVFTRTSNDHQHLKDATGDRRFLPVRTLPRKKGQPNEIGEADLMNIWGNYYRSYLKNPVLYYEDDSKEGVLIAEEREKYKVEDEDLERFEWYLDTPYPADFYDSNTLLHQRREFYREKEEYGQAFKTQSDKERGIEWESIVPRTKVTTTTVIEEIYHTESDRKKTKIKRKIRRHLDNDDSWEKEAKVRIGRKNPTSGWVKKKNEEV